MQIERIWIIKIKIVIDIKIGRNIDTCPLEKQEYNSKRSKNS